MSGHSLTLSNPADDRYYENFLKGVSTAKQTNPNDLALQVLAFQSGDVLLRFAEEGRDLVSCFEHHVEGSFCRTANVFEAALRDDVTQPSFACLGAQT